MDVFWFLPIHGDGRYLGTQHGVRAVDHHHLQQVAQTADELGYGAVQAPGRAQGTKRVRPIGEVVGNAQVHWALRAA